MALVGGNTTATGYGQEYVPMAPPPPPPPIPTYGGLVDDSTAYNASVLGTAPPVAGGGPVITVPDAPAYRDPNNPNVVWNEEYQRWYDTKSGLWRNPDTGTWENWAGTQTWNPNTGKQIPTATANIVNPASLQPTAEGMAAAKAIIQGGKTNAIVATPDRPKTLADFAKESTAPNPFEGIIPPAPYMDATPLPGTLYDMGDGTYATGTDATGWEYLTADELNAKYGPRVVRPNVGPEVGAALDLAYSNAIDAAQRSYRLPGAVTQLTGDTVPYDVPIGNSPFYGVSQQGMNAGTLQPIEPFMDFGGFESLLPEGATSWLPNPDWFPLENTVEFATSPYGAMTYAASIAAGLATGGAGAAAVGGTGAAIARGAAIQAGRGVAANFAGDLLGNALQNYGDKLPEEAKLGGVTPFLLGAAGGILGEGYSARQLDKAIYAGKMANDLPVTIPHQPLDVPSVDQFTGLDVRFTNIVGSEAAEGVYGQPARYVPGVDMGPSAIPGYRSVQLPDGQIVDIRQDTLEFLNPRKPLTINDQANAILNPEAVVGDPRTAFRYPAPDPGAAPVQPVSLREKMVVQPQSGVVTIDGQEVGRIEKLPSGRHELTLPDGTKLDAGSRNNALDKLDTAMQIGRGTRPVEAIVFDTARAAADAAPSPTVARAIAENVSAAVLDPSAENMARTSEGMFQALTNQTVLGMRLGDVAYVLEGIGVKNVTRAVMDERNRILTTIKAFGKGSDEAARIEQLMKGVVQAKYGDDFYATLRYFDEGYTNGTLTDVEESARQLASKIMKGRYKELNGGRSAVWLLPETARPNMYTTRADSIAELMRGGGSRKDILEVLPEGPNLKLKPGVKEADIPPNALPDEMLDYMHGSLASYMTPRDWKKMLDYERLATRAKNADEYTRIKLEQSKVSKADFNPFDPGTHYPSGVIDNGAARKAARAAMKNMPNDAAVPGSASNVRLQAVALGNAEPMEVLLAEAQMQNMAEAVIKDAPEAAQSAKAVATPPQMMSLMAAADPAEVKRSVGKVATGKNVVKQTVAAPFVAMRSILLAGDFMMGRQLWGAAMLYPRQTVSGIMSTLRNVGRRDELWARIAKIADERPHLAPYLVVKGEAGSIEENVTVGAWMLKGKFNPLGAVEDLNGLMKNMVRINLDTKLIPMSAGFTPEQIAMRTHVIGVLTGRGSGKFLDKYASGLTSHLFISPRYTASRFQFLGLMLPFHEGFTGMGIAAAKDPALYRSYMARMIAASSVAAGLYGLLGQIPGVEIVTDPRSSKFGQFRWKENWNDFTGALTDPIKVFSQMATQTGISQSGSEYPIGLHGLEAVKNYVEARIPPVERAFTDRLGYTQPFEDTPLWSGGPEWLKPLQSRYVPLPFASVVEMWKQANDADFGFWDIMAAGGGTALTMAGFGINPISDRLKWEEGIVKDPAAKKALDAKDSDGNWLYWREGTGRRKFSDLNKVGQAYVLANPGMFGEKPKTSMPEYAEKARIIDEGRKAVRFDQEIDDVAFKSGEMQGADWRKAEGERARAASRALSGVYGDFPDEVAVDVVDRYYEAIDNAQVWTGAYTESGEKVYEVDWEKVDRWEAKLTNSEKEQLRRYREILSGKGTALQQEYDKEKLLIEDSGYWDLRDNFYEVWVKDHPDMPPTYDELYDKVYKEAFAAEMANSGNEGRAAQVAREATAGMLDKDFTEAYKATVLYPWVIENPDAAKAAVRWQYLTPDNAADKALFEGETAPILSASEKYTLKKTVTPLYEEPIAAAWQKWASDKELPALSDGSTYASFTDPYEYKTKLAEDQVVQIEKTSGRPATEAEKTSIKAAVETKLAPYFSDAKGDGAIPIRVPSSSTKSGDKQDYISRRAADEMDALAAAYKKNPEGVKAAIAAGLIKDIGVVDKAYLAKYHNIVLE